MTKTTDEGNTASASSSSRPLAGAGKSSAPGAASAHYNDSTDYALTSSEQIETAKWTRHLPEAFGIREAVRSSKYRWCVREAALWGIATGTCMMLHRFRMASRPRFATNIGFGSFMAVYVGSYYFCVKRRDYHEHVIELMMKLNSFEHALNMPQQPPVDDKHPFVKPATDNDDDEAAATIVPQKQYVGHLPERKDWQSPHPTQDAADVFRPANEQQRPKPK